MLAHLDNDLTRCRHDITWIAPQNDVSLLVDITLSITEEVILLGAGSLTGIEVVILVVFLLVFIRLKVFTITQHGGVLCVVTVRLRIFLSVVLFIIGVLRTIASTVVATVSFVRAAFFSRWYDRSQQVILAWLIVSIFEVGVLWYKLCHELIWLLQLDGVVSNA